jgi:cysteine-S-conjugate beta-lyase
MSRHKGLKELKQDTRLVLTGRNPDAYFGIVNPPVARASTILYPDLAAYENPEHQYRYARLGNPMSDTFEEALAELEGGAAAIGTQTGLSAITTSILALAKTGDHILVVDTVYPPVRGFCGNVLTRMGVEVEYYDPCIGAGIKNLIRENTSIIYMESPGSATFEVQDVPAIVEFAKKKNIYTIIDNTWSAGLLFNPIKHGVDISLQSCTKYIGGHSDINLGVIVCADMNVAKRVRQSAHDLGVAPAQEDMALALRGLRTITTRMKQNAANAAKVVEWLQARSEIEQIYYPALKGHKGHNIWLRDFNGVNGLLSILLIPASKEAVHGFVNALSLFPVGSSWGGYESLLQPQYLSKCRVAVPWTKEGALLRLQIGLENPDDLIADLDQAFDIFNKLRG